MVDRQHIGVNGTAIFSGRSGKPIAIASVVVFSEKSRLAIAARAE
jgi:hypothetical protein